MWCPKCKCEYVNGITECPDCHIPLVEELTEDDAENGEIRDDTAEDAVSASETEETAETEDENHDRPKNEYRPMEEKANDLKTSGYTLLVVGLIGMAAILLIITGVIPIGQTGIMRYISNGAMGLLFLIFIVSGAHSLMKSKSASEDAVRENEKRDEIMAWFMNEYDGAKIDAEVNPDEGDNDLYYDRVDFMKEKINERFMDLDEGFTSDMIERMYTELFDDE